MKPTPEMLKSDAFIYASKVKSGEIITGEFIKLAVDRFYLWIKNAEKQGYYLDHNAGQRKIYLV